MVKTNFGTEPFPGIQLVKQSIGVKLLVISGGTVEKARDFRLVKKGRSGLGQIASLTPSYFQLGIDIDLHHIIII